METKLTRAQAEEILFDMTKTDSLRRHARTVELTMRALARHFGEDEELYGVTGLLHDADYEAHPDAHPQVIVQQLRDMGEDVIAQAIAGHYSKWDFPRETLLDKCIIAADELTGFVVAAALIRPTKIEGMKVKSVMKKFKTATFAAKVERDECLTGAELIGMDIRDLVQLIIDALTPHRKELELGAA